MAETPTGLSWSDYAAACRLLRLEPTAWRPTDRPGYLPGSYTAALVQTAAARDRLAAWSERTTDVLGAQSPAPAEILPRLVAVGDDVLAQVLAQVLHRLPPPVTSYVEAAAAFVTAGCHILGFVSPPLPVRPWTIVLAAGADVARFERLVAHEVAHAWLLPEPDPTTTVATAFASETLRSAPLASVPANVLDRVQAMRARAGRDEREAIALAQAWGFGEV